MTTMTKTAVRVVGHYEVEETPFGRSYKWYPAYVNLQCDCGAELTLSGASSSTPACCSRRGTDHSGVIEEIQKREVWLGQEVSYPWSYDTQEQAQQHLRDEAAYPEGSPWRYNDITSRGTHDERNVQ